MAERSMSSIKPVIVTLVLSLKRIVFPMGLSEPKSVRAKVWEMTALYGSASKRLRSPSKMR